MIENLQPENQNQWFFVTSRIAKVMISNCLLSTIPLRGGSRTSPRRGRQSLGGAPTQYFSHIF